MVPTVTCSHQGASATRRVCIHLLESDDADYYQRFTGTGLCYDLVCEECARHPEEIEGLLQQVCEPCLQKIEEHGYWIGILGEAEILERSTTMHFIHQTVELPGYRAEDILDIQPLEAATESIWVALTRAGALVLIDLTNHTVMLLAQLPNSELDLTQPVSLYLAADGQLAAVVNTYGQFGLVIDLEHGQPTMLLKRDTWYLEVSPFAVAFFQHGGQSLLVHATAWNRLDISEPRTGELLTPRIFAPDKQGGPKPEHDLDYFHGRLRVSPNQEWIVDDGWVWHPMGIVVTWNLSHWLDRNPWESEDGPSRKRVCRRQYFWDGPLCWIDDKTLAIWGYGEEDEWLLPAVRLFDVETGEELRWFAGPGIRIPQNKSWYVLPKLHFAFEFDSYLFVISERGGTSVWDIGTGERLLQEAGFCPLRYHRGAKHFLTLLPGGGFQISSLEEQ